MNILASLEEYPCGPGGHDFQRMSTMSDAVGVGPRTDLSKQASASVSYCSVCEKMEHSGRTCLFCDEYAEGAKVLVGPAGERVSGPVCITHWGELTATHISPMPSHGWVPASG